MLFQASTLQEFGVWAVCAFEESNVSRAEACCTCRVHRSQLLTRSWIDALQEHQSMLPLWLHQAAVQAIVCAYQEEYCQRQQ